MAKIALMFPWGAAAPSRWHWMHTYLRTHQKSLAIINAPKKNSEGACGKMLHSTACCVCVWHPSIKIKSKLTEHISRKPHASSILREMASHTPAADCYFNFLWSASHGYMEKHIALAFIRFWWKICLYIGSSNALKKAWFFGNSCFPIESINRVRCTFLGRERVTWYCIKVTFLLTFLNPPKNHGRKIDKIYVREFVIALFEPSFITFDK